MKTFYAKMYAITILIELFGLLSGGIIARIVCGINLLCVVANLYSPHDDQDEIKEGADELKRIISGK